MSCAMNAGESSGAEITYFCSLSGLAKEGDVFSEIQVTAIFVGCVLVKKKGKEEVMLSELFGNMAYVKKVVASC